VVHMVGKWVSETHGTNSHHRYLSSTAQRAWTPEEEGG
jgi:hypothetical protein